MLYYPKKAILTIDILILTSRNYFVLSQFDFDEKM